MMKRFQDGVTCVTKLVPGTEDVLSSLEYVARAEAADRAAGRKPLPLTFVDATGKEWYCVPTPETTATLSMLLWFHCARRTGTNRTRQIILSLKSGLRRSVPLVARLMAAARDLIRALGLGFPAVISFHFDKGHIHLHIVVSLRSVAGKPLSITKGLLRRFCRAAYTAQFRDPMSPAEAERRRKAAESRQRRSKLTELLDLIAAGHLQQLIDQRRLHVTALPGAPTKVTYDELDVTSTELDELAADLLDGRTGFERRPNPAKRGAAALAAKQQLAERLLAGKSLDQLIADGTVTVVRHFGNGTPRTLQFEGYRFLASSLAKSIKVAKSRREEREERKRQAIVSGYEIFKGTPLDRILHRSLKKDLLAARDLIDAARQKLPERRNP